MRIRRALCVATSILVVAAAGCGDDDGGGTGISAGAAGLRQEYVDAIVEISDDGDEAFTVEDRTCMAESFVDGLGVDAMDEAGVTPDDIRADPDSGPGELGFDFSGEQAADFYDRLSGCMNVRAFFLEGMGSGGELPDEAIACLDENISDDLLERFFTVGFTEGDAGFDDDLDQELDDALEPCIQLAGG